MAAVLFLEHFGGIDGRRRLTEGGITVVLEEGDAARRVVLPGVVEVN